jgi:ubiquinone/menaquinone biosynthesis C-methylase UbiE
VALLGGLAAALAAVALLLYWALVLSEGVYLGPRVVTWLYDRVAPRYDRLKNLDPADDTRCLARPLLLALDSVAEPTILDVATGTGRLPLALLAEEGFAGRIVGVDRSRVMLAKARPKLGQDLLRSPLVLADAGRLPFAAGAFAAVTCLEALEFTSSPQATLRELLRVLRPGGTLLLSNRVGTDCLWYPGRLCGRGRLEAALRELGLEQVEREPWQVYYDLVWAKKREPDPRGPAI